MWGARRGIGPPSPAGAGVPGAAGDPADASRISARAGIRLPRAARSGLRAAAEPYPVKMPAQVVAARWTTPTRRTPVAGRMTL